MSREEETTNGPQRCLRRAGGESLLAGAVDVVVAEARHYRVWRMQRADLHQAGMVGLLVAADRFDPGRGVPFRAFARHWVRKEVQRAIADQEFASTVPATLTGPLVAAPTTPSATWSSSGSDTSAPRWSESIGCHRVAQRTGTLGAEPLEDEVRRA